MENFPESSSKGTKRRRDEDSDAGNTFSLEDDLSFTDTLVALRIMRAQFPLINKGSVEPFMLKSQLYSSVKDRTQVDRELESLRRDKVLRLFKLNTGQDDHAVMFLDDYLNQIDRVVKRMEGKKVKEYEVFGWLKTHVLDSKLETGIEHQELCSLLSLGGKVKDSHISVLINAGILTRQLIDPNMYWFAIPNIGSLLKGIVQGRKEIISLLSRRRYKEMMLASLEKKRLRMSPLDITTYESCFILSNQENKLGTSGNHTIEVDGPPCWDHVTRIGLPRFRITNTSEFVGFGFLHSLDEDLA